MSKVLVLYYSARVPLMLLVLILGVVFFQLGKLVIPSSDFGPTIGSGPLATALPFASPLTASGRAAFLEASRALVAVLALVAALESPLAVWHVVKQRQLMRRYPVA